MNILKLFEQGQRQLRADKLAKEAEQGLEKCLRVGNTGYIVDGEIRGRCAREAVMRHYGVDKSFPLPTQLMFRGAEKMEDILIEAFIAAGKKVLAQKEAGFRQKFADTDFEIVGSPDIVFVDTDNKPTHGIEVKMASSVWTSRSIGPFSTYPGVPKSDHLAQAAHYMYRLGQEHGEDYIPYSLTYICPVSYVTHTKDMRGSKLESMFLTRNEKGQVYKLEPHIVTYKLDFNANKVLSYRLEGSSEEHLTDITIPAIEEYFHLVIDSIRNKKLPPRAANKDPHGKDYTFDKYDPKYNDYVHLYEQYEQGIIDFDKLIAKAKTI